MATYRALTNLHHDGKLYAAGKTVKIDDEDQAKALLDVQAIEAIKGDKGEKQSEPPK